MPKFWTSAAFKAQQAEWYRRLEEAGFKDAEKEADGFFKLKVPTAHSGRFGDIFRHAKDPTLREAKAEYYQKISQCVESWTDFDDEHDRLIMERTAEGKSIREISDELKAVLPGDRERSKHNRNTIRYVRRRYEKRWGIREWSKEQMQSRKARTK